MRIFFLADYCIPIHAMTLAERPLGGTETGLIHLAANLHRRGHEVKVFTSHPSPPPSPADSPQYLPFSALPLSGGCDLLVAVQDCRSVFHATHAERVAFWTGDGPEQHTTFGIGDKRFQERVHVMLTVSEWHKKALCASSGFPEARTAIIRNGVELASFASPEERQRHRIIFSSAPHRGLQVALPIFTKLREKVPEAELHIFSGFELYDRETPFSGPQKEVYKSIKERCLNTENCFLHGNVVQSQLAKEYLRSAVYLYPATVPETSCITAIEAKAAGCPAVVSSLGALPETVGKDGIVVPGEPAMDEFVSRASNALFELMRNDTLWQQYSERASNSALSGYSWDHVTDRFEQILMR